ncbi:MAG TPA: acetoacetate--CoA ligase, partial [Solirubrobacteraceae bacterium]
MGSVTGEQPLWTPSPQWAQRTEMVRFMRWAGERHGREFGSYEQLWRWSVQELEDFWAAIWEFCGVRASEPYERVLASRAMPGAVWFEGARLNFAENLLSGHDAGDVAVVHCSELRELGELSWGELSEQVAAVAAGLRGLGVERGDRVVAYMPNIPETLVAFLATASLGAIWSSAAPEFGARSVIDRFAQIEPKVFLTVDGYRHGGKDFDRREAARQILAELPTVQQTVVLPYLDEQADPASVTTGAIAWRELARERSEPLRFEQLPFDHPLWVLYSSGTTGLPKAIVQGHGGILIEQLKKRLHLDLREGDRMFWFTTTGWMMWNFLIGCLHSPAAIVLYDGSPAHPDVSALWRLAERARITCMGLSAGLLGSCEKAGIEPRREQDLASLRAIGSTGSPLSPESFRWVYEHVDPDVWLFSTSGGTDVCTAFVAGCPILPVYEGELQCRALGCAVESWDEQGNSLIDEVGELVVTKALPSMPLFLWGDADG